MENRLPKMMTIRQIAAAKIATEHALRTWVKQGAIPYVKIGNRTLINFDRLLDWLNCEDEKKERAAE